MKRILCATDLSPGCEGAVHRAGMLAQQHGAQLALLHVLDPVLFLEQEQEHVIARLRSQAAPPLWPFEATPTIEVRTGPVANVIRNVAEEAGAELIIMGAQRRRAVGDAVAGTTVERVLRSSGPAVLLVNGDPLNTYRNVLLALDPSPASARAVQIAESLFLGDGARASVVHAYVSPYEGMLAHAGVSDLAIARYSEHWRREARVQIVALLGNVSADANRYDIVLQSAAPFATITKAVERNNPDLVIVGTRGLGRLRRMLLGSVANRVLREMQCDVLVVPAGDQGHTLSSDQVRDSGRTNTSSCLSGSSHS